MESLKFNDVCRICIERRTLLNWNEQMFEFCGMTYKDCYYKYTELSDDAPGYFPSNICEDCADGLKNAHSLFQKALESFEILQVAFEAKEEPDTEICVSEPEIQIQSFDYNMSNEITGVESAKDDKNLIEQEIYLTNMYGNVRVAGTENDIMNSKELTKSEDGAVEHEHFVVIQNYATSSRNILPLKLGESFDAKKQKSSASKRVIKKRKKSAASSVTLTKSKTARTSGRSKCDLSEENLLEEKYDDSRNAETSLQVTNKKASRKRKRNILMCEYCSLKFNVYSRLKKHEATHSEDRERTETCPQCGIKLYNKWSLISHMKTHDEKREKTYKCEFCENAFFNRGSLNVHRRIHLGLMVTCSMCSKKFYRQVDLDRHLLRHSVTPPIDKKGVQLKYTVQCQYCNEHILTKKWREHKAVHLNQPQVKCKICDKNFFARTKCVKHIQRIHLKKKGYEEFIYYYVSPNTRTSLLMLKQQELVKPIVE